MSLKRTPPKASTSSPFSLTLPESNLQHHTGSDSALDSIITRGKRKYMSDEETSMRSFIQEIKGMFNEFAKDQNNKLLTLQSTVSTIKEQNEEISLSLSFLSQKYDEMRSEIDLLKNKQKDSEKYTNVLEHKIELLERKMKINEVEIRNIPKITTKETNQELHKTFQSICTKIGIKIDEGKIKSLYRINTKLEKNKPILIDFVDATSKTMLLTGFKAYNGQHSTKKLNTKELLLDGPEQRIYISESLTFNTKKLFRKARDFAAANNYRFCWTANGIVYMREKEGSKVIKINSEEDIPKTEVSQN